MLPHPYSTLFSMRIKLILLAIPLFVADFALAQDAYVPKFARGVRLAAGPSMNRLGNFPLQADSAARVMDMETCPKPPWPRSSLRNEETGTTTLKLTIAATGEVVDGMIFRSSGYRDLDNAALRGMRECVFKPAGINGVPVESDVRMQYVWTLK